MNTEGFDPHLDIALLGGLMTEEEVKQYRVQPTKELKAKRHGAKTTNYSCVYGAYPPKIARTAKIPLDEAKVLWETYWKRNWAVKKVAESVETIKIILDDHVANAIEEEWLLNPLNGFYYSLRSEKDKFSTLNQGTGSYCFDVWLGFILSKRPQLTAQFHDEGVWVIKKGYEKQMTELLLWAIEQTNESLQLNRRLDIDINYGENYGEVH